MRINDMKTEETEETRVYILEIQAFVIRKYQ